MEIDELERSFFISCCPSFFRAQIQIILSKWNEQATQVTVLNLLATIDTFISILLTHSVPLVLAFKETLEDFLLSDFRRLTSVIPIQIQLKCQFLLHFELLRIENLNKDPHFIEKIGVVGRALCMALSIEEDSSSFYRYYISDILPRYCSHIEHQVLLQVSMNWEFYDETRLFLNEIVIVKPAPKKRKVQKSITNRIVKSPIRRSPRLNPNIILNFKDSKKQSISRNLSGSSNSLKKQIKMKSSLKPYPFTPERKQSEISTEAKRLKEINKNYFYEKREGLDKKKQKLDDSEQIENDYNKRILVLDTPTKPQMDIHYEIKSCRNIFNNL